MRIRTNLLGMSAGLALLGGVSLAPSSAHAVVLPGGPCGLGPGDVCLEFGDFTVYSLALLNFNAGAGDLNPGDPFYVGSSPGQLGDVLVVASKPASATDNQDAFAGLADDAYDTTAFGGNIPAASGNVNGDSGNLSSTQEVFRMGDLPVQSDPVPNPLLPVDHASLWDVNLDALNGLDPVFYFNLNDTGNPSLDGEDLLGWMQVILYDALGNPSAPFTLDGTGPDMVPGVTNFAQDNVSDILPDADDLWAHVHGKICRDAGGNVTFGPYPCAGDTINQHLGANTAAFALVSEDLNAAIATGLWTTMSVDLRLAYLNNGYEQLFILGEGETTPPIPEPSTLALLAAGLLGLGTILRRRRTKAA